MDPAAFKLFTDKKYLLPTILPNGNYQPKKKVEASDDSDNNGDEDED